MHRAERLAVHEAARCIAILDAIDRDLDQRGLVDSEYNTRRESFPETIFAGALGFGAAELLAATESAEERKAPQVKF